MLKRNKSHRDVLFHFDCKTVGGWCGGGNCRNLVGNSATSPKVQGGVGFVSLVSNFWELSFPKEQFQNHEFSRRGGGYYEEFTMISLVCTQET